MSVREYKLERNAEKRRDVLAAQFPDKEFVVRAWRFRWAVYLKHYPNGEFTLTPCA